MGVGRGHHPVAEPIVKNRGDNPVHGSNGSLYFPSTADLKSALSFLLTSYGCLLFLYSFRNVFNLQVEVISKNI